MFTSEVRIRITTKTTKMSPSPAPSLKLMRPIDLLAHGLEELAPRVLVEFFVGQELDEPAQREERRSQLVGRVADEFPPCAFELGEPLAHPLEGTGKLAELVRTRIVDRLVEESGGDPLRRRLEPAVAGAVIS